MLLFKCKLTNRSSGKPVQNVISWGLSVSIYEYAGMHVYDPMTVAHQAPLSMEL